jgi:hypothetical protein
MVLADLRDMELDKFDILYFFDILNCILRLEIINLPSIGNIVIAIIVAIIIIINIVPVPTSISHGCCISTDGDTVSTAAARHERFPPESSNGNGNGNDKRLVVLVVEEFFFVIVL